MLFSFFQRRGRKRILSQPFPPAWRLVLNEDFSPYNRLDAADKKLLEDRIQIFIAEKRYEGIAGLEITDQMRVLVAAQACLLILHRDSDYYPNLVSILIYPHSYNATSKKTLPGGVVVEEASTRLGESWTSGSVILSWDTIQRDSDLPLDGHNLVYHEFAHQLDQENGAVDGAPKLGEGLDFKERKNEYVVWANIMVPEFDRLVIAKQHGSKTLLDHYGAKNLAEFFAVATEAFFEKPKTMARKHPNLYSEFKDYYHQDPASWPQ